MDVFVLNKDFETVSIIDGFRSFIWTDRYNACGDFELVVPMYETLLTDIQMDYYLRCPLSDRTMIVESIELTSDEDEGTFATFTGRSLESILERRVIWGYYVYSGSMQTGIQEILTKNVISPSNSNRTISNFIYETSSITDVTEIEYDFALFGDNLYSVIQECCKANDVGFKVVLNESNQFVFSLYVGQDLSLNQTLLPFVIFSPIFNNLLSSKYYRSDIIKKTVSMVAGEGESESERTIVEATVDGGSWEETSRTTKRRWGFKPRDENSSSVGTYSGGTGLERKEIYTDASGVSKTYYDDYNEEQTMTDSEYAKQLVIKGQEDLSSYFTTQTFEGETDFEGQYMYGRDYQIGDILQIENEYGITSSVRVEEVVNTIDESGQSVVPGFTAI